MTKAEVNVCMRFARPVRLKNPKEPYGDGTFVIKELDKLIPRQKAGKSDRFFQYYAHLYSTEGYRSPGYTLNINELTVDESCAEFVKGQVVQIEKNFMKNIIKQKLAAGENKTSLAKWIKELADELKPNSKQPVINNKMLNEFCREIIEHLNKKTGASYEPTAKKTKELVAARINEGRSVKDFIKVIDNMCDDWLGDEKMRKNLRPSTLFRVSHFEEYLNRPAAAGKSQIKSTYDLDKIARDTMYNDDYDID